MHSTIIYTWSIKYFFVKQIYLYIITPNSLFNFHFHFQKMTAFIVLIFFSFHPKWGKPQSTSSWNGMVWGSAPFGLFMKLIKYPRFGSENTVKNEFGMKTIMHCLTLYAGVIYRCSIKSVFNFGFHFQELTVFIFSLCFHS